MLIQEMIYQDQYVHETNKQQPHCGIQCHQAVGEHVNHASVLLSPEWHWVGTAHLI